MFTFREYPRSAQVTGAVTRNRILMSPNEPTLPESDNNWSATDLTVALLSAILGPNRTY